MKALFLTNEYPPHIYGGAGVHVEFLTAELARMMDVEVRCFGDQQVDADHLRVRGYGADEEGMTAPPLLKPVFATMARDVAFAATDADADVVHCHTWYSHLGGVLIKLAYGIPLVVTVHSLEPLRPWKREQIQGGYEVSSWVERTALEMADAVIAVSRETREDVLRLFDIRSERVHVIPNGIDLDLYHPTEATTALTQYRIDPARPYVLFVGRITRQKGIVHLVRAIPSIAPAAQVVLCAGAPDTPEIAAEMQQAVAEVQAQRDGVIWIQQMVRATPSSSSTPMPPPSAARRSTSRSASSTSRRWRARRPSSGLRWAVSRTSWSTVRPVFSSRWSCSPRLRSSRSTRCAIARTSRRRSTRSSPTPHWGSEWEQPDAAASKTTSAGAPSPSRPPRCIGH
jgi:glycogen synthase